MPTIFTGKSKQENENTLNSDFSWSFASQILIVFLFGVIVNNLIIMRLEHTYLKTNYRIRRDVRQESSFVFHIFQT